MTKEQHSKTNVYGLGMASIILATSIVAVGHTGNASAGVVSEYESQGPENILYYGEFGQGPSYAYPPISGNQGEKDLPGMKGEQQPEIKGEAPAPEYPKADERTWYQKLWDYVKGIFRLAGQKLGFTK